ncbi:MAG: hypothetical protein ACRDD8_04930 [Bacteroidales bacterium]
MNLNEIFNIDGSFKLPYDPYRRDDENKEQMEFHSKIFNEDGDLIIDQSDIYKFIVENNCDLQSDAIMCYFGDEMSERTDGAYPCIYMWK